MHVEKNFIVMGKKNHFKVEYKDRSRSCSRLSGHGLMSWLAVSLIINISSLWKKCHFKVEYRNRSRSCSLLLAVAVAANSLIINIQVYYHKQTSKVHLPSRGITSKFFTNISSSPESLPPSACSLGLALFASL